MTFLQRMEKLSLKKRKSDMVAHVLFCISTVVIKITNAIWKGKDLFLLMAYRPSSWEVRAELKTGTEADTMEEKGFLQNLKRLPRGSTAHKYLGIPRWELRKGFSACLQVNLVVEFSQLRFPLVKAQLVLS